MNTNANRAPEGAGLRVGQQMRRSLNNGLSEIVTYVRGPREVYEVRDASGCLLDVYAGDLTPLAPDVGRGTHGSPELDADAAKLEAMGADPGPTLEDFGLTPAPEGRGDARFEMGDKVRWMQRRDAVVTSGVEDDRGGYTYEIHDAEGWLMVSRESELTPLASPADAPPEGNVWATQTGQSLIAQAVGASPADAPSAPSPEEARPPRVTHELKTWPMYFRALLSGEKTFEYRRDDRGFNVGDVLRLREWGGATMEYSGRECLRRVTYIAPAGPIIPEGFCIMSIEPMSDSRVVSPSAGARMSDGVSLIAAERARQVSEEGWDATHDDDHVFGEIAQAAACYALPADNRAYSLGPNVPRLWPWSIAFWKPTPGDRIRELVKAGALIAAEIDRLQRVDPSQPSTDAESRP